MSDFQAMRNTTEPVTATSDTGIGSAAHSERPQAHGQNPVSHGHSIAPGAAQNAPGGQSFQQGPNIAHELDSNSNTPSSATAQHFPAGIGSGATHPGNHKEHLGPFTGVWQKISELTPGTEANAAKHAEKKASKQAA